MSWPPTATMTSPRWPPRRSYRAGLAYQKQAQTADRDQGTAGQAIARFTDFMALYPNDPRVPQAQKIIATLRREQARGNFDIAQFYEKYKKWEGARIYYNEVLLQDPNSPYAPEARQRIDQLKQQAQGRPNSMRLCRWLLVGLVALGASGCAGYKLGPVNGLAAREKSVQINPFANQTLEPRLGDAVTSQLRKQLQRDGTYQLASHNDGDIVVSGSITRYTRHEFSFSLERRPHRARLPAGAHERR